MITIIELEKCVANAYILYIVIGKFSYLEKLSPISILLVIDESPKISVMI